MLTLPAVRQEADHDCGTAAVETVCRYYGVPTGAPLSLANPVQGMSPDTAEALLRSAGLSVLSGTMTVADLKHLTSTGRPVLCPIDLYGGHWVVVAGVQRGCVHFHDPAVDDDQTVVRKWPAAKFEEKWRDRTTKGQQYERWGVCAAAA